MKKSLLFFLFIILASALQAQKDTVSVTNYQMTKSALADAASASLTIYPVPIKENTFTIKSEKGISGVKVTNIIGQDIFKVKYNSSENLIRIVLDNPKRGMYLVTVNLEDGVRVVKKVMIEQVE
jgi:hypothetical protein